MPLVGTPLGESVLAYLDANPGLAEPLVWCVATPGPVVTMTALARERANEFLAMAHIDQCSCGESIALYPNGKMLGWPDLDPHRCTGEERKPKPVARVDARVSGVDW